jgi:hypothetical protein
MMVIINNADEERLVLDEVTFVGRFGKYRITCI